MEQKFSINIPDFLTPVVEFFRGHSEAILFSLVIILGGVMLIFFLLGVALRPWRRLLSPQAVLVIRKGIVYGVFVIVVMMVLQQFGVKLTALLGAAGILGVAIGFAAQTSLSNIISGVFLLWERPFEIGDVIRVGDKTGVVESIDLLSLTLRTFDNLSVRFPNESLVKGELTNITKHPIRRFDIKLGVSYRENPEQMLELLRDIARKNPNVLEEPEPLVAFTGFGESQLEFTLGVWHEKGELIRVRNSILADIKNRFAEAGVEIPYPHRVVIAPREPAT